MTIPVAVVGYGMSGRRIHAALIRSVPGLVVAAVVARSPEQVDAARQENPSAAVVPSVEALGTLIAPPTLAIVATPDATHEGIAAALLAQGIGAIVEKPLAGSAAAARALQAQAAEGALLLTGFLNRRWDSDFLTVRDVIATGQLGEITRFESSLTRWFAGAAPGWRGRPVPGGLDGTLGGFGSHLVDQAVALFGPVQRVYAEIDTRRPESDVNDDVFLALEHRSGVRTHLTMGMMRTTPTARFRVQGINGSFEKHGFDGQQQALLAEGDPLAVDWGTEPEAAWGVQVVDGTAVAVPTARGDWRRFYVLLEKAVRTGVAPPVDIADVVHTLDVLEAARRSSATGAVVTIAA